MAVIRRLTDEKDAGMQRADEKLAEVEQRISDIYSQAATELTENFDAFMARFEAKDEIYRQRVLDGEMPEEEWIRWRTGQILRSEEMQLQIDNLAIGLTRTDELAVAAIRGDMPYIYTDAYNFGGYRGELLAQAAGYNYSQFTVYNTDAIRIIAAEDPDLIPWDEPELDKDKDIRWNRRHVQDAIAQGILQGEGIPELSRRLLPIVNMDENAARRTARTAFTSVQNQGRRDATARVKAAGIPMVEPWMSVLASNTRDTHLLLHGTYPNDQGKYGEGIIPSGHLLRWPADPLGDPEQIYNCQCRVQSYIEGIDHSHDDELYAAFMQENYYEHWLEVKDYKAADRAVALERQRQLLNGEVENREARIYRNRVAREATAKINGMDFTGQRDAIDQLQNMDTQGGATWASAINRTQYIVNDGSGEGDNREHYDISNDQVVLFADSSSARTFYHETAHAIDNNIIEVETRITGRTQVIGSDEWRENNPFVDRANGASRAISTIYEHTENAWDRDLQGFKRWVGVDADIDDPDFMLASLRRCREFENQYGTDATSVLADIVDAFTLGKTPLEYYGGHGASYWQNYNNQYMELWAHVSSLEAAGETDALNAIEQIFPSRVAATRQVYNIAFRGGESYVNRNVTDRGYRISEEIIEIRRNTRF